MNTCEAIRMIHMTNRVVFRKSDLRRLLGGGASAEKTIERLVYGEILLRAARGVYVYDLARDKGDVLYAVARNLRRGEAVYESFTSAAALRGLISQSAAGLNLATSGSSHRFDTPYGSIEFIHVPNAFETVNDAASCTRRTREGIPLATDQTILADCERNRRAVSLIKEEKDRDRNGYR